MPPRRKTREHSSLVHRRTKIVHLTCVHPPHDTRILYRECRTLSDAGFEVVLIAPGVVDSTECGVTIRVIQKHGRRLARMILSPVAILRRAGRERADVYHFHDPELIPAALLLKLRGYQVFYDVHEDLPRQIRAKHWITPWLRRPVGLAVELGERIAARAFDGIVAATPTIAERFPAKKTVVVQNFPIVSEFTQVRSERSHPAVFAYVGALTVIRGAREMVKAVGGIEREHDVRLNCYGRIEPPELEAELRELAGWCRTDLLGWGSRVKIAQLLARAHAGLVVLHPTPNYLDSYPVKLFEYMASGLPVIASDFPLWRTIVEGAGCGLLVDPLDPEAIESAMRWILEHPQEAESMGRRGRDAVLRHYDWRAQGERLIAFYEERVDMVPRRVDA